MPGEHADKRTRLVDTATKLAHTQGFRETSLADIAGAAHVPIGNVYYYFKTKEELGEAVVERRQENDRGQDNLAARIQALGADRSRLADELDISISRSRSLEDANRHIAERIDGAIETIRSVLKSEQET